MKKTVFLNKIKVNGFERHGSQKALSRLHETCCRKLKEHNHCHIAITILVDDH